ncbi:MAG: diguanylate cyclase [Pseudomonadales bacterium]
MFQITIWSISPLLSALVAAGTYLRLRTKTRVPGMQALLTLLALVLFWSGCLFVESLFVAGAIKRLAVLAATVAINLVPVCWFAFAICYTRRQMRLSRLTLNLVCIVPLVTAVLACSNDWHHLVWTGQQLVTAEGYVGLRTEPGLWGQLQFVYSYGVSVVATSILAYALAQTTDELKPVLAVIAAPLMVAVANLSHVFSWHPSPWFDLTSLGLAAAALVLDRGVLRYGVLDTIPVLRDRVLEQLSEGVVVINATGAIVDINRAALRLLDLNRGELGNRQLASVLPNVVLGDLLQGGGDPLEVTLRGRTYDVSSSRLDPTDPAPDAVLVFRDVTKRRETEQELREAQRELERLAHTDPLTGLNNRRLFMQRLAEEVQRAERSDGCLSVLLFDLDYFKRVNDRHGHDVGDQVLQQVARAACEVKRMSDVAARIGGEEFALLLPETSQSGAMHVAQRLRAAIEAADTPDPEGRPITVTASIGVATLSCPSSNPLRILKLADSALYRAKRAGRNQVCRAGDGEFAGT